MGAKYLTIAMLIVITGGTVVAYGQQQIKSGNTLDANPRVGSGSINHGTSDELFGVIGNATVTGNVAGLKSFRGSVGYQAAGEFQGVAGSDTLFNFHRSSVPSSLTTIRMRRTGVPIRDMPVLRPSSASRGSDIRLGNSRSTSLAIGRGYLNDTTRAGLLTSGTRTHRADPSGITMTQVHRLSLLPLFGVPRMTASQIMPDGLVAIDAHNHPSKLMVNPDKLDLTMDDRLRADELNLPPLDLQKTDSQKKKISGLSALLGRNIQMMSEPQHTESGQTQLEQQILQLRDAMFRPLESSHAEPGENVHLDRLAQVKEKTDQEDLETEELIENNYVPQPSPDTLKSFLANPTGQQIDDTKTDLKAEILSTYDLPSPSGQTSGTESPLPESVRQFLNALRQSEHPIGSLAGKGHTYVDELLREAETAMAAGQYMDAERQYRYAALAAKNQPMAIVGLVHAQLGAGLYRVAAFNLRTLTESYPELAAVRYMPNLLPDARRLEKVQDELDEKIESDHTNLGLLLAYIGFQTNNEKLVRYGLDLSQAQNPVDSLIPLLRQVWLEQTPVADHNATMHDPEIETIQ